MNNIYIIVCEQLVVSEPYFALDMDTSTTEYVLFIHKVFLITRYSIEC